MLMDEPFSAVDPVVRAQLQDEFIRLQADLGKTIVFVTHDIDEAVKLGDRIAVFAVGGRLAQFADAGRGPEPPVGRFRRGLRRSRPGLSGTVLRRGRRSAAAPGAHAVPGRRRCRPTPARRPKESPTAHGRWLLVVDEKRQPRGWLDCRTVAAGHRVVVDDLVLGGSLAGPDASLRTALDAALSSPSGRGVAVDANTEVIGTVAARDVLDAIEQARGTAVVDPTGGVGPAQQGGGRLVNWAWLERNTDQIVSWLIAHFWLALIPTIARVCSSRCRSAPSRTGTAGRTRP